MTATCVDTYTVSLWRLGSCLHVDSHGTYRKHLLDHEDQGIRHVLNGLHWYVHLMQCALCLLAKYVPNCLSLFSPSLTHNPNVLSQGWSDFSGDHGTYNNSWTWNELVLVVQADGSGGPTGGGGGHGSSGAGGREAVYKPVREGDPGRLFTNRHASVRWQQHRTRLGPTSLVVQDLNAHVFVAQAGGGGGREPLPGCSAAGGGEDRQQEEVQAAGEGQDAGLGGGQGGAGAGGTEEPAVAAGSGEPHYQLQLLQCAAFPGWTHFMRSANITLELRARLA